MLSRRSLLLAGAAGLVAAATGCGDDEEDPAATGTSPAPASSTERAAPAAPAGPDAERIAQFRLPNPGAPGGLDWNPAGDLLAVTGPGQVALFPAGGGAAVVAAKAHGTSMANSVSWAPDGSRFATVGTDSVLQFWAADGVPTRSVQLKGVERHGVVRWSPAGNLLAVSTGNTPLVVDVSGGEPGQPVAGTKVEVLYEVAWAPDGASYYAVGVGGVTRNPAPSGPPSATLTDAGVRVWRSVAVAPDGRLVVAARPAQGATQPDTQDLIRVYNPDLVTFGPPFELPAGTSTVTAMRFAPDGKRVVIGFQQGPVGVWEVTGTQARYVGGYRGHARPGAGGYGLACQPGTDRVASLDADGSIHLWHIKS
jgi:WD40 repeat protein